MAKHDENQDVQILSKRFAVNRFNKTINALKSDIIGLKSWSRIDYLTHYCGYTFIWGTTIAVDKSTFDNADKKKEFRKAKKAAKEHKLTDKTRKQSNKK